jgi:hypothetical protein
MPGSHLSPYVLAWGNVESGQSAHDDAALNALLDWIALANAPHEENRLQRLGFSPAAIGAVNVDGKELVAASAIEKIEALSRQEHGPQLLPPSSQADMELNGVSSEGRWESADQPAGENEAAGTQDGGRWTKLMNLPLVLSIPMILAYWFTAKLRDSRSCRARHPKP